MQIMIFLLLMQEKTADITVGDPRFMRPQDLLNSYTFNHLTYVLTGWEAGAKPWDPSSIWR
ncbi:hypothetical protein CE195_09755 [Sodalis-like symbiont of Philaenus spumarius]|nr:hypothetical protein CE195_09755 [Sodalis-like symbiont of Philaenus spumarius]